MGADAETGQEGSGCQGNTEEADREEKTGSEACGEKTGRKAFIRAHAGR